MSAASPELASPDSATLDGVAALPHLGVIRARGEDAASFLHGQLTQDFLLLPQGQARLAAFCSAKGRMQAAFVAVKAPDGDILLVGSLDVLPTVLKRLSMFVLRAKVKLTDASAELALRGLAGSAAGTGAAWEVRTEASAMVVTLPPAGPVARALWIAPTGTPSPAGSPLAPDRWIWGEVRSGVATTLSLPVVDAFVPQMLNYESVGGVNFKKGCYPGQEVVARSQFRGTLKRRAFVAHVDGSTQAGAEVFSANDASQPAGTVVQAAPAPSGGMDAIVSLQLASVDAGGLRAGAPDGPAVSLLPLPYDLLEDI